MLKLAVVQLFTTPQSTYDLALPMPLYWYSEDRSISIYLCTFQFRLLRIFSAPFRLVSYFKFVLPSLICITFYYKSPFRRLTSLFSLHPKLSDCRLAISGGFGTLSSHRSMCLFGRLVPSVPNSLECDVPDWSRHDSHVVSPPIYTARFRCCIWVIVFRTVPM